jgi:hypothetical protein
VTPQTTPILQIQHARGKKISCAFETLTNMKNVKCQRNVMPYVHGAEEKSGLFTYNSKSYKCMTSFFC